MTKLERFEDIKAWQKAKALVGMVYEAVKPKELKEPKELNKPNKLKQLNKLIN